MQSCVADFSQLGSDVAAAHPRSVRVGLEKSRPRECQSSSSSFADSMSRWPSCPSPVLEFSRPMDFAFSDHQVLLRDTVRQFMETEVRPHVKDWERTDHFPLETIQKLGALGCCGMLIPEEWGGAGFDTVSYVLMLEEVARVHTAMCTALSVTNSAVQLPLLAYGTEAQKSRYLKSLASGKVIGSFCLTEPAAGSDAAAFK